MSTRSGLFPRVLVNSPLSETPVPAKHTATTIRRRIVLDNDPLAAVATVEQLRNELLALGVCDSASARRVGVALEEALLNAIYHGNLEIRSELKESGDESFHALASERRMQEPFASRRVRFMVSISRTQAKFVIEDNGPGFDVSKLPDPTEPENLERPCGRGLLLMRAFMDEVCYNATGNRVTLVVRRKQA